MTRRRASDYPPQVLELFDAYVHGALSRRDFLKQAGRFAVGGLTATALLEGLAPNYALARQVPPDDDRVASVRIRYESPGGHGSVEGLLARPAEDEGQAAAGRLAGVLVLHENRGLNPYIEDVARRFAAAGFLALAPDGLSSVGGYPGTDDEGRALQSELDAEKLIADFLAGAKHLAAHEACSGRVGVVGFCFGGMVANELAVRWPELAAAVPFYGRQAAVEEVGRIRACLQLHFAENDPRVNEGWPAYEAALKAHDVNHVAHFYPGTSHGFHNDTTPRYDEAAARLAWTRTVDFLRETLVSPREDAWVAPAAPVAPAEPAAHEPKTPPRRP